MFTVAHLREDCKDYLLPDASSGIVPCMNTTKRVKLVIIVISPREKTPHKAIFWRLRSWRQLMMKKGKMNTAVH
jgi:hypothetical protein